MRLGVFVAAVIAALAVTAGAPAKPAYGWHTYTTTITWPGEYVTTSRGWRLPVSNVRPQVEIDGRYIYVATSRYVSWTIMACRGITNLRATKAAATLTRTPATNILRLYLRTGLFCGQYPTEGDTSQLSITYWG